MEFYRVGEDLRPNALTFMEAAEIFKATSTEPGFELPAAHYPHVQAALEIFERDFLGAATETVTTTDKADAFSTQAKKFLRDMKGITVHAHVKAACVALTDLVDKGMYTALPNELKKIRQQMEKRAITLAQVDNLLMALAKKYGAQDDDTSESQHDLVDFSVAPEVVLSETFIE